MYVEEMQKTNNINITSGLKKEGISLDWFYTLPDNTANDMAWGLDNLHFMLYVMILYSGLMSMNTENIDEHCDDTIKFYDMLEELVTLYDNKNDVINIIKIARMYRKYVSFESEDDADAFLKEKGIEIENAIKSCSGLSKDEIDGHIQDPLAFFVSKAFKVVAITCEYPNSDEYARIVNIIKLYYPKCPIYT
jgi:hypothetical protein